jgi:hypothetical protein
MKVYKLDRVHKKKLYQMTQLYTATVSYQAESENTDWGEKVKISVTPDDPNAPKVYSGNGRIYIRKKPESKEAAYMWSLKSGDRVQLLLNDNGKNQWYDFILPSDFVPGKTPATHEAPDIPRVGHTNKTQQKQEATPRPPFGAAVEALRPEMFEILRPYYEDAASLLKELGVEPTGEAISAMAATAFIRASRQYEMGDYGFDVSRYEGEDEEQDSSGPLPDMLDKFEKMTDGLEKQDKKAASTAVLKAIASILDEDVTIIAGVLNEFGISYDTFVLERGYWNDMLSLCYMYNSLASQGVEDINGQIEAAFGVKHVGDEPPF